ncbi:MAG: ATP-binding protein, partial [Anaerolineae bacterium]
MVDYYKLRALSHLRSREVVDFESRMSDAIDLANELAEDPEATDLHAENLHFLQGVKYGGLARYETDPSLSAEQYFRASDAYGEVDSVVARGRSVFHQLMGYQSLMRSKLGKGPQDFEETALVCREALSKLWDSGEIEVLRTTEVLTYRTLFESLCLFTTEDLCPERWYRASRFHERVQAEPLEESARWIWNLAYGTRLVEGGGVTLGEITTKLRAAVRSAICQLLEGSAVSQREIYDDLVAVQVSDDTLERKKYIMSLLRRRRLGEEGLELECKQFFYDPNYESPHVVSSLREEVVAFLNSRTGGQIVIGVQDETFAPRGIEKDLQRFEGSEARLKDAVLNHITSTVQEGLPLPNITVSVEAIAGDKQVIYIDVPPGDYDRSLYKTNKGVAYIRMDGSKRTIKNAVEQDELAAQRRQGKGPWAPAR